MAASASKSMAALESSGEVASSTWPRSACRREDVVEGGRAVLELVLETRLGFLEQVEDR